MGQDLQLFPGSVIQNVDLSIIAGRNDDVTSFSQLRAKDRGIEGVRGGNNGGEGAKEHSGGQVEELELVGGLRCVLSRD